MKTLEPLVRILVLVVAVAIIGFVCWLFVGQIGVFRETTALHASLSEDQQRSGNAQLEAKESELARAKESIQQKKDELIELRQAKRVEKDLLTQIEDVAFFADPQSDEHYTAKRNREDVTAELKAIEEELFALEHESTFHAHDDEVIALIENKQAAERDVLLARQTGRQPFVFFAKLASLVRDETTQRSLIKIALSALVLIGIAMLLRYVWRVYNTIVMSENQVDNTFANVDVCLKKRWDLIPNIVESVKGYSAHEAGVLTEVTTLRSTNRNALNLDERIALEDELSSGVTSLLLLQEQYPDLKANSHFLDLSQQLAFLEEDIAASRITYNDAVMRYHNTIEVFPQNLVAWMLGKQEREMFSIASDQAGAVAIDF